MVGKHLLVFSDGIVDAKNAAEEMFGNDRLCSTLEHLTDHSAEGAVGEVLDAVSKFKAGREHCGSARPLVPKARLPVLAFTGRLLVSDPAYHHEAIPISEASVDSTISKEGVAVLQLAVHLGQQVGV